MRLRTALIVAILATCIITSAIPAFGQKLYPVQGPLASQTPPPVFSGHLKRPMFGVGAMAKVLKILDRRQWRGARRKVRRSDSDLRQQQDAGHAREFSSATESGICLGRHFRRGLLQCAHSWCEGLAGNLQGESGNCLANGDAGATWPRPEQRFLSRHRGRQLRERLQTGVGAVECR